MKAPAYQTKISVVPIINVSLVIVLTLMTIAPFLNEAQEVSLPEARASEVDDADNVEITFTAEREIWVADVQLALEEVRPYLADLFAHAPEAVAVLKADRSLPYGEVERLIAEVESADASRIAIATREKKGTEGSS